MPKRSRKKLPADPNAAARSIVDAATEETGAQPTPPPGALYQPKPEPEKNPAAVALGRLGGLKGGAARAKALTKKQRAEIAKKAALTRWRQK